jgi:ribose/xylose/arabinose/galactoside ABC-type transport system permease subunit
LAKLCLFGKNLSKLTKHFLIKQPSSFYLLYFIFIFILISYTQFAVIYCEGQDLSVAAVVENVQVTLLYGTGDFIKQVVENIGAATVFSAGIKVGASILSKHKISIIPRLGTIGGTGVGFTVAFKLINAYTLSGNNSPITNSFTFHLGSAIPTSPNTSAEGLNYSLARFFGTGGQRIDAPITFNNHNMMITAEQTSDVINELNNQNPD